jgi:hypothetical protein
MAVCRRDVDRQRDGVLLNRHLDLDAADLLATVNAARKTAWRRAAGAAVDDHDARFRSITAGAPPTAVMPIKQPTPKAEPGPAGEQSVECVERNIAELSDRSPLHTAKTDTPDRHHRLAQRRSGQRLSISVEKFPGNSVQKFPLCQPGFGCFLRCLKRNESLPVSRISQWWVMRSSKAVVAWVPIAAAGCRPSSWPSVPPALRRRRRQHRQTHPMGQERFLQDGRRCP